MCFRLGFILPRDTDVSALVQDFIKAQPAVYCGKRLPRLILLQYIPFCSFLAPKSSQVGTLCRCHISQVQWNCQGICLTYIEPPIAQSMSAWSWDPSRGQLIWWVLAYLLVSLLSCRGCHSYSIWDGGRGHPSKLSAKRVGAQLHDEEVQILCSLGMSLTLPSVSSPIWMAGSNPGLRRCEDSLRGCTEKAECPSPGWHLGESPVRWALGSSPGREDDVQVRKPPPPTLLSAFAMEKLCTAELVLPPASTEEPG